MTADRDTEYQDPELPGSLVAAFRTWQSLVAGGVQAERRHFVFTFYCGSASVAEAVSWSLHCRDTCEATVASCTGNAEWHVRGTTRPRIPSLDRLERLFTWLRVIGLDHDARLTELSV